MSILIKSMEMPTGCLSCGFCNPFVDEPYCRLLMRRTPKVSRLDGCPLIEIPDGHGRLIDADALMKEFEKAENTMAKHGQEYSFSFMSSSQEISTEWYAVEEMVDNSPNIIPTDKEEVKE